MKPGGIAVNPFGSSNDTVRMNPPRNLINRPAGLTDPEVHFVSKRATDRRPIALLANYSLHYVGGLTAGRYLPVTLAYFPALLKRHWERTPDWSGSCPMVPGRHQEHQLSRSAPASENHPTHDRDRPTHRRPCAHNA